MSDITYARRADTLSEVETESVPERLALAHVHATQGVARALREVDGKLKYVADRIVEALPQPVERWITWQDADNVHRAVAVRHVMSLRSAAGKTDLLMIDGGVVTVPFEYGTVALMVGI